MYSICARGDAGFALLCLKWQFSFESLIFSENIIRFLLFKDGRKFTVFFSRSVISALRLEQLKMPTDFNVVPQSLLNNMAALRAQGDINKRIDRDSESLNDMTEELKKLISDTETTIDQLTQVSRSGRFMDCS